MSENLNPSQNLASARLAPKQYSTFDFNAAREANLDNSTVIAAMQSRESNINWNDLNKAISSNIPKDLSDETSKKAWVEQETINAIMQASYDGLVYFTNTPLAREVIEQKPQKQENNDYIPTALDDTASVTFSDKQRAREEAQAQDKIKERIDEAEKYAEYGRNLGQTGFIADVKGTMRALNYGLNPFYDNSLYDAAMEKKIQRLRTEGKSWEDLEMHDKFWLIDHKEINKVGWDKKELLDSASKKVYEALSPDENQAWKDSRGFFTKVWDWLYRGVKDEKGSFEVWKNAKFARELAPEVNRARQIVDNIDVSVFDIAKQFYTGEVDKEKFEQTLNAIYKVAQASGFSAMATDSKHNIYIGQEDWADEQFVLLDDFMLNNMKEALWDNKFSIASSILFASKGFKKGKSAWGKFGYALGYGAVGSALGAVPDALLADRILDRESTAKRILEHSISEATFNAVGDIAALGVGKVLKVAGKGIVRAGKATKGEKLTRFTGKLGDIVKEYMPVISFINRTLDGNAKAADKLIAQTMTREQQAALKEFGDAFGGNIQFTQESKSVLGAKIKEKFGAESVQAKAFETISNAMSLPTQHEKQQAYIQAIRADKTGNLIGFLNETLAQSPAAMTNFRHILNQTTHEVEKNLENLNLNQKDIKGVFDDLEKGTKESYDNAMNNVLGKIYDDSYKTVISRKGQKPKIKGDYDDDLNAFILEVEGRTSEIIEQGTKGYDDFRLELSQSGVSPADSHAFLNFVENTIYNPQGVTFKQLLNAQKVLNSFYKETKDPNLKSHIKNAIESFLRDDIKKGIDDIFRQNPTAYKDAVTLYETILTDYANMKSIIKMVDKVKIRNKETTQETAVESLIKLSQGQGDKTNNFEAIARALTPENRKVLEMNILEALFARSLYDKNSLRVLDSGEFFKNLKSLPQDLFQSREAKDFIDIAAGFDKLYKNDVLIARAIKPATTARVGSSIATSIEGAAKFQIVRIAFDQIIRLMPHIPFTTGLNERISGAAMRYHLKTALERSSSVSEFKQNLKGIVARSPHNNQTNEIIKKITQAVDTAQNTIIQGAGAIKAEAEQAIKEAEAEAASTVNPHAAQNIPTNKVAQGADSTHPLAPSAQGGGIRATQMLNKTADLNNGLPSDNTTRNTSADDLASPAQNTQSAQNSIPTQSADKTTPSAKFSENEPSFKQKAEEFFRHFIQTPQINHVSVEKYADFRVLAIPTLKNLNIQATEREMRALHKFTKVKIDAYLSQNLTNPKVKTINAVDRYLESTEASTLTGEQINAITALKDINPEAMPENIDISKGFDDLLSHFKESKDKEQREVFLKLFEATKERPNITLQVHKEGKTRNEYIKAFQHKQTKDLYYIAIFGEGENARVTGIPTTDIKYIINEISKGEVKNVFK